MGLAQLPLRRHPRQRRMGVSHSSLQALALQVPVSSVCSWRTKMSKHIANVVVSAGLPTVTPLFSSKQTESFVEASCCSSQTCQHLYHCWQVHNYSGNIQRECPEDTVPSGQITWPRMSMVTKINWCIPKVLDKQTIVTAKSAAEVNSSPIVSLGVDTTLYHVIQHPVHLLSLTI